MNRRQAHRKYDLKCVQNFHKRQFLWLVWLVKRVKMHYNIFNQIKLKWQCQQCSIVYYTKPFERKFGGMSYLVERRYCKYTTIISHSLHQQHFLNFCLMAVWFVQKWNKWNIAHQMKYISKTCSSGPPQQYLLLQ